MIPGMAGTMRAEWTVSCAKCYKYSDICRPAREQAVKAFVARGWRDVGATEGERWICPECTGVRPHSLFDTRERMEGERRGTSS